MRARHWAYFFVFASTMLCMEAARAIEPLDALFLTPPTQEDVTIQIVGEMPATFIEWSYHVHRLIDRQTGVICYILPGHGDSIMNSISCLPAPKP